jgi:hypothetical protein
VTLTATAQSTPPCFGLSWSAEATECKGGLDPGYINPSNGTNRRDPCRWYSQCASRTAAIKLASHPPPQQLITTNRLAQPHQPPVVPFQAGPGRPVQIQSAPQQQPFHPPYPPQQYQSTVPYTMVMVPANQAYYGPPMVPMAHQVPGAQMLAYLSVPEPVVPGTGWFGRLLFELFRAVIKAACHQAAHYVDHRSFVKPAEPQQPQIVTVPPPQ